MQTANPAENQKLHIYDSELAAAQNTVLADFILNLPVEDFARRTHYFNGRYENLYIDPEMHPALTIILDEAVNRAAELLGLAATDLQAGFWINLMHKGDITTLHSHDDDDELLSAVYYLQVPEASGLFKLHVNEKSQVITPIEGRFMFFDPALPHEVTEHCNDIPRISIGINFGMVKQDS